MLSVIDFERGERAKGEQAHQWGTVFQTALPYFLNTLATLGIVFQTNLLTNYKLGTEYWLPDKTSYQLQTWSAVWKTVPSAARVTRDAVSGFITMKRRAVWKTVPPTERSIR